MRNQFDAVRFSVAIKLWRTMNQLTAREMADLNGIAVSTYSFIENGDRPPTIAEFSHLCSTIGFEARDFFKAPEKGNHDGK